MVLDGELYCAPISKQTSRILDLGTGTGAWAIDVALYVEHNFRNHDDKFYDINMPGGIAKTRKQLSPVSKKESNHIKRHNSHVYRNGSKPNSISLVGVPWLKAIENLRLTIACFKGFRLTVNSR